jgi:hypothetical protein
MLLFPPPRASPVSVICPGLFLAETAHASCPGRPYLTLSLGLNAASKVRRLWHDAGITMAYTSVHHNHSSSTWPSQLRALPFYWHSVTITFSLVDTFLIAEEPEFSHCSTVLSTGTIDEAMMAITVCPYMQRLNI